MNDYFRVDGRLEDKTTEAYHPTTAKYHYRGLYYELRFYHHRHSRTI